MASSCDEIVPATSGLEGRDVLILLAVRSVTMTTSLSSPVKDENGIFTSRDVEIKF